MSILRDSLVLGSLMAAMLIVHSIDRRKSPTDSTAGSATPPATTAHIPADDRAPATDNDASGLPPGDDGSTLESKLTRHENAHRRTGIIDSFEPYAPRMIDEPPPPPPNLIETPPAAPPRLVESDEPPAVIPEPPPVRFFEIETRAQSVGYVVDCSSSMSGERFRAVCSKLAESILDLKRDQEFFVVFFNDRFFPMTGSAAPKLVKADLGHKRAILRFLVSAEASGGTDPEPALRFMTTVRPDVIYLLTDGEFSPLGEATYQGFKDAGIVVHTLGFDTVGQISILDEIARRTGGTYQPTPLGTSSVGLLFAPENAVRKALSAPNPELRRDAVQAAVLRGLPFEIQVINMLGDADADIRDTIHGELRAAADGSDFGPATPDDVKGAIRRWRLWRTLQGAGRSRLLSALRGSDPDTRRVAAAIARSTSLDAPDELIAAMRLGPPQALADLRAALVRCSGGEDFGPAPDATSEQVTESVKLWQAWRDAVLDREAPNRHEQRIRRAADLLAMAKQLIGVNDAAVERRYRELATEYGDTPAGEEARSLLEALVRSESPSGPER